MKFFKGFKSIILLLFSLVMLSNCSTLVYKYSDYFIEDSSIQTDRIREAQSSIDTSKLTADEKNTIFIYRKYNKAVVNITTLTQRYNIFMQPYPQEGSGSGSIIRKDGVVLTNYHVIKDADFLKITLYDGDSYDVEIMGFDQENDIAVLKFDPKEKTLITIELGTSQNLVVGQKVIALGNPFGLDRTLTTGVISGLNRPLKTEYGFIIRDLIQLDASINPGNSGGPLLNSEGKLIGVNALIISPSGGSVGIGFAIPVDTARRVIPELIQNGKVARGWINIKPVPLYPILKLKANITTKTGILVSEVESGSNAEIAGLKGGDPDNSILIRGQQVYLGGDIILRINNISVSTIADYLSILEPTKPGDVVTLLILRTGNETENSIKLNKRPDEFPW